MQSFERSPDPDELLRHAGWMHGLARGLLADPGLAEDAVQETWLKLITRPPRRNAGEPRAWLGQVLRNAARQIGRTERRRARHEQLASEGHTAGESAADVVERTALHRRVVEEVLALPEPYRTTVLERYFDGAAPREIARALGVSSEVVRTRLSRALAMLRARLDERHGGDRKAWAGALLCTPYLRSSATLAGAGGAWSSPLVALLLLLGALVGLGAFTLWNPGRGEALTNREDGAELVQADTLARSGVIEPAMVDMRREAVAAGVVPSGEDLAAGGATQPESERQVRLVLDGSTSKRPVSASSPTELAALEGVVLGPNAEPVTRFLILLSERDPIGTTRLDHFFDPGGRFRIDGLRPGRSTLFVRAEGYATGEPLDLRLSAHETHYLDPLHLILGATVSGRVVTPAGEPPTAAKVCSGDPRQAALARVGRGELGALCVEMELDGRFSLRDLRPGEVRLRAFANGWAPSVGRLLTLAPGEQRADLTIVLRPAAKLTGSVTDEAGYVVPHQLVSATRALSPVSQTAVAHTDAAGRFAFETLEPGSWDVAISPASLGLRTVGGTLSDDRSEFELEALERVELFSGEEHEVHLIGRPPED